ncbi:MAG TPA: phosphatase PAP2-related protein, partial [Patescibacteria group bacterium]|nr:phosphatase PAP2-related protein [Patescibacteria group bacterium]
YSLITAISIILFFIYCYKKGIHKISYFFILIGMYQILRAIFIILTPFGNPNGPNLSFLGQFFTYGLYPSGHTGGAFLFYLLSSGVYKKIFLVFTFIIMITLLLGRGHYTIDIFSALIFSYTVYMFGEKYLKRKVLGK